MKPRPRISNTAFVHTPDIEHSPQPGSHVRALAVQDTAQRRQPHARALRVLHLSHNDRMGGGPLASYRLHRTLRDQGIASRMSVLRKHHDDPAIDMPAALPSRLVETASRIADRLPLRAYPGRARDVVWSPGWFSWPGVLDQRSVREADLLCLYWINGGFLSVSAIGSLLALNKPVVWRLSDLWPFTGGCHHPGDCTAYRKACGRCPQLGSNAVTDLSTRMLGEKKRWPMEQLVIVSPSRWLADLARNSAVFGACRIERITTGVDIDLFAPEPKLEARRRLGLPEDKALVLFGANNGIRNPKKGFSYLLEAIERLKTLGKANRLDLVIFGQDSLPAAVTLPAPVHVMGRIHDERRMATLFSAADIFATPSLEENLPNTVIEAMSCGTPTVAFAVGGTAELIDHETNGYLAPPKDSAAFSRGLAFLLDRRDDMQSLQRSARDFITAHHDIRRIAAQYIDLYTDLAGNGMGRRAA
ncbi:MAG: glycosyltransferase family 4 protein [Geminicoccaceae bacterium]